MVVVVVAAAVVALPVLPLAGGADDAEVERDLPARFSVLGRVVVVVCGLLAAAVGAESKK